MNSISEFIFESSERSDKNNNARKVLEQSIYDLINFEGYTIKNNKVSLLLDRVKLESSAELRVEDLYEEIKSKLGNQFYIKENFANSLGINWYFVVYRENEQSIILDMINAKRIARFQSYKDLAIWTQKFRDNRMTKKFNHTADLPKIDQRMREFDIPWPGNMDKALCLDNKVLAIIEFQNTDSEKRATVRQHDNNNFFKQDILRWKVLDQLRNHAGVPLLVIVWSETENIVGIKLVEDIIYFKSEKESPGIKWAIEPIYSNVKNIVSEIEEILNLKN
ncbi:hypothetical protein ACRBU7_14395 [Priestia aryabhattai]|uniref:hypothetical protein n=1 Tax=Priestia aryabhattai TaxID=412384 RepID=UPI003D7FD6B7